MRHTDKLMPALLVVMLVLMMHTAALAVDDEVITEVSSAALTVDWSAVLSKLMVGIVGAAGTLAAGLLAYITKRYILPNLPALIQWLKDKNLLALAKTLVEAAEAQLGRYTGDEKWEQVCAWFEARGFTITDEVEQAIKAAWLELNNTMIELGLKDAEETEETAETEETKEETTETTEQDGSEETTVTA